MSHAPGPWVMEHDPDEWNHEGNKGVTRILGPNGMTIIGNFQYYPVAPDELDDYRLIAAAPELLALLKEAMPCVAGYENDRGAPISENDLSARIQRLIAKAEGK
jgi:hypothetical protein